MGTSGQKANRSAGLSYVRSLGFTNEQVNAAIEQAAALSEGDELMPEDFPLRPASAGAPGEVVPEAPKADDGSPTLAEA